MMKMPADYLLRKGDVVMILVVVKYDLAAGDTSVHTTLPDLYSTITVDLDKIQGIHALKWDIGDKVFRGSYVSRGTILRHPVCEVLAVHGEEVWVKLPSGSTQTVKSNDLRPWVEREIRLDGLTEYDLPVGIGPTVESDEDYRQRLLALTLGVEDRDSAIFEVGADLDAIGLRNALPRRGA